MSFQTSIEWNHKNKTKNLSIWPTLTDTLKKEYKVLSFIQIINYALVQKIHDHDPGIYLHSKNKNKNNNHKQFPGSSSYLLSHGRIEKFHSIFRQCFIK